MTMTPADRLAVMARRNAESGVDPDTAAAMLERLRAEAAELLSPAGPADA